MKTLMIKDLSWSYSRQSGFSLAIKSLDIHKGQNVFVTGASGSGKSTFLDILAGVVSNPLVDRMAVFPSVVYIMHQSTLAPWLCIEQNLSLEEKLRNTSADKDLFIEVVERTGLSWGRIKSLFPRELSLGMRQRLEIAKGLAFKPSLFLMDEGLSGMDVETREVVIQELNMRIPELGTTLLFTSHNMIDGLRLADGVITVKDGHVSGLRYLVSSRAEREALSIEKLLRSPDAASFL